MNSQTSVQFCLGFDPRDGFHSQGFLLQEYKRLGCIDFWSLVLEKNLHAYKDRAQAVKFQSAFFENMGLDGFLTLKKCIDLTRSYLPKLEIILDFKRSDIGSTMDAYLEFAFARLGADTVTIVPYYGLSTLTSWQKSKFKERSIFLVAVGTERDEQKMQYQFMTSLLTRVDPACRDRLGLVVGANLSEDILRSEAFVENFRPYRWLIPGVGAQGSGFKATLERLNPPLHSLISSSREATGIGDKVDIKSWGEYKVILEQSR